MDRWRDASCATFRHYSALACSEQRYNRYKEISNKYIEKGLAVENEVEAKGKPEVDIEIEDDTPEEDRGRTPLPKEIVQELEADELEEYSDKVKTRLKQMKKVMRMV